MSMHIKFVVELECESNADQNELQQKIQIALESSFLFDKGASNVKVTKQ